MKLMTFALLGGIAATGILGCEATVVAPRPVAAVEIDAGAPVVYDSFYVGGYYDGPYWVWHDHDGRIVRESREIHERRVTEHNHPAEHRAVEHHEEHQDEHHDDHR